jgi:FlaA1/EpsC-like NDP-sugar epimerase
VIDKVVSLCEDTGVDFKILPGLYKFLKIGGIQEIRAVSVEDLLKRNIVVSDLTSTKSYLTGRVVLITGAGGSIGSELSRQIAGFNPSKLILLENSENALYTLEMDLKKYFPKKMLVPMLSDIRNYDNLSKILKKFQPYAIFHTAAYKHVPMLEYHPGEAIRNNVIGTLNLVKLADEIGVSLFTLISTDKAVNPTSVMGASKRITELIISAYKNSKTKFVGVRFGNVLESSGSVIPLFKKQISGGGPVTVTDPKMYRYFMTTSEAAQLVLLAGSIGKSGEILILDMGEPYKILDIAKKLIRLSGFKVGKDIKIKIIGKRPGEKLNEQILTIGCRSTQNNRIFVSPPDNIDVDWLLTEINLLEQIAKTNDTKNIICQLKIIVPEFKHEELSF